MICLTTINIAYFHHHHPMCLEQHETHYQRPSFAACMLQTAAEGAPPASDLDLTSNQGLFFASRDMVDGTHGFHGEMVNSGHIG
jgi:hypothetical protein